MLHTQKIAFIGSFCSIYCYCNAQDTLGMLLCSLSLGDANSSLMLCVNFRTTPRRGFTCTDEQRAALVQGRNRGFWLDDESETGCSVRAHFFWHLTLLLTHWQANQAQKTTQHGIPNSVATCEPKLLMCSFSWGKFWILMKCFLQLIWFILNDWLLIVFAQIWS